MYLWLEYVLPITAAFLYAAASIMLKQALNLGVGPLRSLFICNILLMPLAIPLYMWDHTLSSTASIWSPIICTAFLFLGSIFVLIALKCGDVSIQTPLTNTKILIVVALAYYFGKESVQWNWIVGGCLASLALFIMSKQDVQSSSTQKTLLQTILWTLLSALFFALCDVYIEAKASNFGPSVFLTSILVLNGLFSFGLIPFFKAPLKAITPRAWIWLIGGGILMAFEAALLYFAIAFGGRASVVNILYSTRGIFGLILVSLVSLWLPDFESYKSPKIRRARYIGGALLTVGIMITAAR